MTRIRPPRTGFTLLEVMLSAAIGVLLLAALYVAVDIQVRHAQEARDMVEHSTLARALFNRISQDLTASLAAPDPSPARTSSGSSGSGSGGGSGAAGASGGGSPTGSGAGGAGAASSGQPASGSGAASSSSSGAAAVTLGGTVSSSQLVIKGDSTQLSIFVARSPREWTRPANALAEETAAGVFCDVRRISYWLGADGGLARREDKLPTSEDANTMPSDLPEDTHLILAREVRSLTFSYFDGTAWVDSWDGTTVPDGGDAPMGPPLAIAVTLAIHRHGGGPDDVKQYRHVIAIPTANGATAQTTDDSSTTAP